MSDPIDTLVSEISTAGAERERELLHTAASLAESNGWITEDVWGRAKTWIHLGAYLSAAEALNRGLDGYDLQISGRCNEDGWAARLTGYELEEYLGLAATEPLARVSAALQAHKAKEG